MTGDRKGDKYSTGMFKKGARPLFGDVSLDSDGKISDFSINKNETSPFMSPFSCIALITAISLFFTSLPLDFARAADKPRELAAAGSRGRGGPGSTLAIDPMCDEMKLEIGPDGNVRERKTSPQPGRIEPMAKKSKLNHPFNSFAEEKEFRRTHAIGIEAPNYFDDEDRLPWSTAENEVESGIQEVVRALNRLPFAYTSAWSHSGLPSDHPRNTDAEDLAISVNSWLWRVAHGRATYGTDRMQSYLPLYERFCGFITFRADYQSQRYQTFTEKINQLEGVRLSTSLRNGPYGQERLILINAKELAKPDNESEYERYMRTKWSQVLEVIQSADRASPADGAETEEDARQPATPDKPEENGDSAHLSAEGDTEQTARPDKPAKADGNKRGRGNSGEVGKPPQRANARPMEALLMPGGGEPFDDGSRRLFGPKLLHKYPADLRGINGPPGEPDNPAEPPAKPQGDAERDSGERGRPHEHTIETFDEHFVAMNRAREALSALAPHLQASQLDDNTLALIDDTMALSWEMGVEVITCDQNPSIDFATDGKLATNPEKMANNLTTLKHRLRALEGGLRNELIAALEDFINATTTFRNCAVEIGAERVARHIKENLAPPSTAGELYSRIRGKLKEIAIPDEDIEAVIRAMGENDRINFVPPALRDVAYNDVPFDIGEGQTISQPFVAALMSALLELEGDEEILAVGTGSGWSDAVLGSLVPRGNVYSVERIPALAAMGAKNLKTAGRENVHVKVGDASSQFSIRELFGEKKFDRIVVAAAAKEIPQHLLGSLKLGGKIVIPVGEPGKPQNLIRGTRQMADEGGDEILWESIMPVQFVPFVVGDGSEGTSPGSGTESGGGMSLDAWELVATDPKVTPTDLLGYVQAQIAGGLSGEGVIVAIRDALRAPEYREKLREFDKLLEKEGLLRNNEEAFAEEILRINTINCIHAGVREEAQVAGEERTIVAWEGYGNSQEEFVERITDVTEGRVRFEDIDGLAEFARAQPEDARDRVVVVVPQNERILSPAKRKLLEEANVGVIYIDLEGERLETGDLAPIEGLIALGKAYLNDDMRAFYQLYELLTGRKDYPRISLERLKKDPDLFITMLHFVLRPIRGFSPDERERILKRMRALLIAV